MKGKKRMAISDKKPKYTRGGILYQDKTLADTGKGWTSEGIERFNQLFDAIKRDRKKYPGFMTRFLENERQMFEKKVKEMKRKAIEVPTARHELFSDSDNEQEQPTKKFKELQSDEESVASD